MTPPGLTPFMTTMESDVIPPIRTFAVRSSYVERNMRKSLPDMPNMLGFLNKHSSNAAFWSRKVTYALLARSTWWKMVSCQLKAAVMQIRPF